MKLLLWFFNKHIFLLQIKLKSFSNMIWLTRPKGLAKLM